ncbi:hypothetical protein [Streptomyces sp. NPDC060194]|uniref:hypothetical protein n=1 Tax=Streptomyces sp. NPDC060194 TaxID=3347069 RepID=UPI00364EBDE3
MTDPARVLGALTAGGAVLLGALLACAEGLIHRYRNRKSRMTNHQRWQAFFFTLAAGQAFATVYLLDNGAWTAAAITALLGLWTVQLAFMEQARHRKAVGYCCGTYAHSGHLVHAARCPRELQLDDLVLTAGPCCPLQAAAPDQPRHSTNCRNRKDTAA